MKIENITRGCINNKFIRTKVQLPLSWPCVEGSHWLTKSQGKQSKMEINIGERFSLSALESMAKQCKNLEAGNLNIPHGEARQEQ